MSALEQFKNDKKRARELANIFGRGMQPLLNSFEGDLVARALTMFAEQDETKQNCLVIGK